jgi:hypothetical protein
MKIDDYKKANCSWFRIPPVNFSSLEKDIEKTIMDAWRSGYDPNSAINYVINDQKIINKITGQISQSLEFQRKIGISQVKEEKEKNTEIHKKNYQERIREIREKIGEKVVLKKEKLQEEQERYTQQNLSYSASSASLEEMKYRIKDKLESLGGEKGIEALLKIEEQLAIPLEETPKTKKEKEPKYKTERENIIGRPDKDTKKKGLEKKTEEALKTIPDPNKGETDYNLSDTDNSEIDDSGNKPKKEFWKTVWKVLNYKIW